jgi:hypothetical protein
MVDKNSSSGSIDKEPVISLKDKNIDYLAQSAGSDEAISRGKLLAFLVIIVGVVGGLASAVKPIYRKHFAENAKRIASQVAAPNTPGFSSVVNNSNEKVDQLLSRLAVLKEEQVKNKPWLR